MLRRSLPLMVVLALVANIAFAQQQPQRPNFLKAFRNMRMPAAILLMMPEVQTELKITEEQKTKMAAMREVVQKEIQTELIGSFDFQALGSMSEEERDKKLAEVRTKIDTLSESIDTRVEKVLDKEQMKRLRQLRLQMEGATAFVHPDVVAKLKLNDTQKEKIQTIQEDALGQFRSGLNRNATPEERQAAMTKMQESRAKSLHSVLDLLDDDQLLEWNDMTGKEFKFPTNMMDAFRGLGAGFGRGRGGN